MDFLQMAILSKDLHGDLARSALPNAPVVPDDAARFIRSRAAAAGILRRVADLVAPEPATVRPKLASEGGTC